jgi:hypothetical protein
MIYARPAPDAPLTQGDLIDECPLVYWVMEADEQGVPRHQSTGSHERIVVLTQACDLANLKASNVQVAVVHEAQTLVAEGLLKAQTIRDQVRRHRVFGWYFLPASGEMPESIVNLREIHTVPRQLLEELTQQGHRHVSLATPYREHLAQHFAVTYSRIALPEEFATQID